MRQSMLAALAVLAVGCGFKAVGNGDMGGGGSGGNGGGAGSGGSGGNGGSGGSGGSDGGTFVGNCAPPVLLVTAANTLNDGSAAPGQVVRLSLHTDGTTSSCSSLTGQGLVGSLLNVSTFLPPRYVVTADGDSVYAIDGDTNLIKWTKTAASSGREWLPLEAFDMQDTSTKAFAVIVYGMVGSDPEEMTEMDGFYADGTSPAPSPWCMSGTSGCTSSLSLGLGVLGVMADPAAPTQLFAVDPENNVAAWLVTPFDSPPQKKSFIADNGDYLQKSYAISVGGKTRIAWLNNNANQPNAIDYADDAATAPSLSGPLRCNSGCANFSRVVPDPTSPTSFFLLCEGTSIGNNSVARLAADGTCTTVFDGTQLPANYNLTHIAVY